MPSALVFELRPHTSTLITASMSRAAHAWLLDLIERDAPDVAARLHGQGELRPFTTTFVPSQSLGQGPTMVSPAQTCALRVTLLSKELEALATGWSAERLGELVLQGVHWRLERVARSAAEHRWAGQVSYDQLVTQATGQAGAEVGRWELEFATPVTFRQRGKNQPLPMADLVFGSLLERWNAASPLPLPVTLRGAVEAQVAVSSLDLRSVMLPTKGGALQVGSVGRCGYTLIGRDRTWQVGLDLLCSFAFYSGIGAGTTRGFGLARLSDRSVGRVRAALPTRRAAQ